MTSLPETVHGITYDKCPFCGDIHAVGMCPTSDDDRLLWEAAKDAMHGMLIRGDTNNRDPAYIRDKSFGIASAMLAEFKKRRAAKETP